MVVFAAAKVLDAGLGWAVGKAGDAALKRLFHDAAARAELVEITAAGVAAALEVAPELEPDLASAAYANTLLGPAVMEVLKQRTGEIEPEALAQAFLSRFVEPYLRERQQDEVLISVFRLDPERLHRAFAAMAGCLRTGLLCSRHWREEIEGAVLDDIQRRLIDLQTRIPAPAAPEVTHEAALEAGRRDARLSSEILRAWPQTIAQLHIARPEAERLRRQVHEHPGATTLLVGVAGAGKSALLARLTTQLETDGFTVFAIKADRLPPDVASFADLSRALGLNRPIDEGIEALAAAGPVALLIDQLDAVSEVMDSSGRRMRLLLSLARRLGRPRDAAPVHVLVSSRPFEASYDAGFETLGAERFTLELPPYPEVEALLDDRFGIGAERVPPGLREALRRPFLLKLFVELTQRRAVAPDLMEGELLNAWLAAAPLGDGRDRSAVLDLLKVLAEDMTKSEALWRPADRFEREAPEALRRAEACELIVRSDGKLSFAHQTWVDDFQARSFTSATALAEYAWSVQDGLFSRATVLRALERMRAVDDPAYVKALDALLGEAPTRRHLRHLVVDLIASQAAPTPREAAWVRSFIASDAALARRAMAAIVTHWAAWRETLTPSIPMLLAAKGLDPSALAVLAAEAQLDPASAEALLLRCCAAPEQDYLAFKLAWRAKLWSKSICARLQQVFARGELAAWTVADFMGELLKAGRTPDAIELFFTFLEAAPRRPGETPVFEGLEALVAAAPVTMAQRLLPWFVMVLGAPEAGGSVREAYHASGSLPLNWEDPFESGTVFAALRDALNRTATTEPAVFLNLTAGVEDVEADEVQAVIAYGFAAGAAGLAEPALQWLLRDRRRFQLGKVHVEDEHGVGRMSDDWATRGLLAAVVPHASRQELSALRDALENWDGYVPSIWAQDEARLRRDRRRWGEERRVGLLGLLPQDLLAPRRRRQVAEALRNEPRLRHRGRRLLSAAKSPMSAAAMTKASDAEIMGLFEVAGKARRGRDFGYRDPASAFAAFAADNPSRAIGLVLERFVAGEHDGVAGELVQALAQRRAVPEGEILTLVRRLLARGFTGPNFRSNVAWALKAIAPALGGLESSELAKLEAWIVTDPAIMSHRIEEARRLAREAVERVAPAQLPMAHPLLFGLAGAATVVLPGGNYPFLSAAAVGLLTHEPPRAQAWLELLERHAGRAEEAEVWATLLPRYGIHLLDLDRPRVQALFARLWRTTPEAFDRPAEGFLWTYRMLLPPEARAGMVERWLASPDREARQLGGEYAMAAALLGETEREREIAALVGGGETPETVGRAFTLAAAWRSEPELRGTAHKVVMALAASAGPRVSAALATALREPPPPDASTREFLQAAAGNPILLGTLCDNDLVETLQSLLLEAGFEALTLELAERLAELRIDDQIGPGLVALAIALQRGPEPQRRRAMTLYERLLDVGVIGADEAARASLQR